MGDWTGTVPTILAGDVVTGDDWASVLDELTAVSATWTSYTPTWSTSGTAPVLGNGTLQGRYARVGTWVQFEILFQAGSTSTFGTGTFRFTLPATPTIMSNRAVFSNAGIEDSGTGNYPASCTFNGTTIEVFTGAGLLVATTATSPMAWTTSDKFYIRGECRTA